ncbi:hypothetical protein CSA08_01455 [Candidatus Gracilibacteria bacterium]|nr:MAG: hypothetical protein CSA08_01455 [Candidatus Gracilibacteria bacterium]
MARKYEKSSGGIVYRKRGDKIEVLLLKWLNSRGIEEFVIPKGKIEDGEVAKDTALREINEETGLLVNDLEIIKFITKLNYTFTAGHLDGNPVIDKDVYLFLVKYNGNIDPIVRKEERFIGYKWANIKKLDSMNVKFDIFGIVQKNKTYFI